MLSYLLLPENIAFAFALGLLLLLGGLQVGAFLLGTELFSSFDEAIDGLEAPGFEAPGFEAPGFEAAAEMTPNLGADADAFGADASAGDGASQALTEVQGSAAGFGLSLLSLLGVGKVPVVFSFLFFLFTYSAVGYNGQLLLIDLGLGPLPVWLGSLVALALSLPVLRFGNELLSRVVPHDETTAVSQKSFVGKLARITVGTASFVRHTEARLRDEYGHTHLVQVFADAEGERFAAGKEVVIVGRRGNQFTVVEAPLALRLEE